jgi:hypothetical protein
MIVKPLSPGSVRQCTRCKEWKFIGAFRTDAVPPQSRQVCRDCFSDWLDEEWAREHPH